MDLPTCLKHYELNNLKRVAGNVYCTAEYDNLKVSNGISGYTETRNIQVKMYHAWKR